jgi:hypothetical protein
MTKGQVIKTIEITTPHRTVTVPRVTYAGEFYGKKNYYTHCYNSMAQPITGGIMFVEGSSMAKRFGVE